jgi:hypothetical protein
MVSPIARCPRHSFFEAALELEPRTVVDLEETMAECPMCGREVPIRDGRYRGRVGDVEQELVWALTDPAWSPARAKDLRLVLLTVQRSTSDQREEALYEVASVDPALSALLLDISRSDGHPQGALDAAAAVLHAVEGLTPSLTTRRSRADEAQVRALVHEALSGRVG